MFFRRLGQYLIALSQQASFILGSIVFKLPVFIPYFFPSAQPFFGLLASPTVKQWLSPVGFYGLLFFATFLAWKKERDLREQQSPEALQNRVTELKLELEYSKPRTLTSEQRRVLVDRLKSAFPDRRDRIEYVVRPDDAEAVSYAIQFITALSREGLSAGGYMSNTDLPLDFQGLALCVKELSNIPKPTLIVAQALRDAGVSCRFARIDELKLGIWAAQEYRITLAIGSKPGRTR